MLLEYESRQNASKGGIENAECFDWGRFIRQCAGADLSPQQYTCKSVGANSFVKSLIENCEVNKPRCE